MISHTQTPAFFGWTGTILHVNLSDCAVTRLATPAYSDKYLGGRGIALRLY
jgi:aldehyde:ferredoxin oxidoreductase